MSQKPSAQSAVEPSDEEAYEIGYGKPPKHTRFKPGQSGNPKGRPPGARNFRTAIREALQEKVVIRENGRTRKLPKMDAIIQVALNKGLKGDPKGFAAIVQLARWAGLMEEEPDTSSRESLGAEDQAILDDYLARLGVKLPATDSDANAAEDPKPEGQA
jgi:Family of unknown function (DUF5681)